MEPPPPRSFVPIAKAGSFGGVPCIYTQNTMPMAAAADPQLQSPVAAQQLEPAAVAPSDLSAKAAAELAAAAAAGGLYYAPQQAAVPQQFFIGPGGNIYALNPQLFYPAAAGPSILPPQPLLQNVMLSADGVLCGYAAAGSSAPTCPDAVDVGTQSEDVSNKPQQEHLLYVENAGRCSFTCAQLGPLYSQQRHHLPSARSGQLSSQSYPSNQSVPTSQLSFQSSFSGASAIPESEYSAASGAGAGGEPSQSGASESLSLLSASASALPLQLQLEPLPMQLPLMEADQQQQQ